MPRRPALTNREIRVLREIVSLGFQNAAAGLSEMVSREIKVISPNLRFVPIDRIPNLLGCPDTEAIAIYLKISGDVNGHVMLILSPEAAGELIAMLLGPGERNMLELLELEKSALGEVANVTGSFFLSALADKTNLAMHPSPPAVMIDMVGAVLDIPLAPLALSVEDVLVIDTWFIDNERQIKSLFLVLPDAESQGIIAGRLSQKYD